MSNLQSNLSYLRNSKGLTQQMMADKMNMPRPTYSGWERGSSEPSIENLIRLCQIFGVSLDSLVSDDIASGDYEHHVSDHFRVLAISVDESDRQLIDYVPVKAEAGYLAAFGDPTYIAELPKIRIPGIPEGTYRAFEIQGESMLPVEPSSIVIARYMERIDDIKEGRTYVVLTTEGLVYKRLRYAGIDHHLMAISDNPAYAPYLIGYQEIREIWQYHCHVSFNDAVRHAEIDIHSKLDHLQASLDSLKNQIGY